MKGKDPIEDLKRANRELLALYDINRLLQTQLSTEEKLYIILTSLTAGDGFGYSRAYLLLTNEQKDSLDGWLGVGPLTGDEAREIWEGVTELEREDTGPGRKNLADLLERAPFDIKVRAFSVPVTRGHGQPVQAVISRRPRLIKDVSSAGDQVHPEFSGLLSGHQAAFIPLLSKSRSMGVIVVESEPGGAEIDEGALRTLTIFGNLAAIALENAKLYRDLGEKVSSLEEVNRELQEAQTKILQLDRLATMGVIAAGVAHEIKNPLNSLIINLHLLKEELPAKMAETRKLMDVVEKESHRLNRTVNDFLSYSKVPKLTLELIHPHSLLDEALDMVEFQGREMGIGIEKEYDAGVVETMLDDKRMKQAFLNIILNAIQAMPTGGRLKVKTGFHDGGDEINGERHFYVEFEDSGTGIPKAAMGRLFDPFYTTKEAGTGLGLPIVDSIVRSHGGTVGIDSRPGKGTKVTLCIPLKSEG